MKLRTLALLMLVFLMVPTISYGTASGVTDSRDNKSIQLMTALGIMEEDKNTGMFWDNTPVERREMAIILCNLFKLEPTAEESPRFIDVAEKDRAYIETIVRNGYMSGYSDTRFGAKDYITGEQLTKIFVTVLGGESMAESLGGFPQGYLQVARRLGLLKYQSASMSASARRIDVANMISAALDADIMILEGISDDGGMYRVEEGVTFLTEVLNIYRIEGIVKQNEFTALDSPDGTDEGMIVVGDETCYDSGHISDDYLGCYVTAYVHIPNKNVIGELIYIEENDNNIIDISSEDFVGISGTTVKYRDGDKIKSLEMSYVCDMIYNGKAIGYSVDRFDIKTGNLRFIDNNKDRKYDVATIKSYETYIVEKVNIDEKTILAKFGGAPIKLKDDFYRIYQNGKEIGLEEIGSGTVLLAAVSDEVNGSRSIELLVSDERVLGSVDITRINSDGETVLDIGGKEYTVSDYCDSIMASNYLKSIKAGDSGQFCLDAFGKIAYFDASSGTKKVGYMIDAAFNRGVFSGTLTLKIYTEEGVIKNFKSEDKIRLNGVKTEVIKINENLFAGKQLLEYDESEGILTEVNIANNGYDYENFSMDYSGSLRCISKSVLGYKYLTSASTKVFRVPIVAEDVENYNDIINNEALYQNLSGTYFNGGDTYTVSLYDLNEYNEARYAVVTYDPFAADIWYNYPMIIVTDVAEGIDNDENVVILKGLDANGAEVKLTCANREVLTDIGLKRELIVGDVLQYRNGIDGKLAQIIIQHDSTRTEYYMPRELDRSIDGIHVTKAYGKLLRNDGLNAAIYCGGTDEFDMIARNAGGIVYSYNKERDVIRKINFADIEPESDVFVCCNYSGLWMMVVSE